MDREQTILFEKLDLPIALEDLSDEELITAEDHLADELQLYGIENGRLNAYGELC